MAMATRQRPRTLTARGYQQSVDAFGVGVGPAERVRASSVLDKVAGLTLLAIGAGAVGYVANSPGLLIACLVLGAVSGMAACWAPRTARYLAAPYAITEGVVLGAISHLYESINGRIVPLAVLVTAAIYVTTLISYRSGLVRVTHRFYSMALAATVGFLVVLVFGLFAGLPTFGPMAAVIGAVGILVGVMNLFIDFDFIYRAESSGMPKAAEWNMAVLVLVSLVLVYLNVLRFIAALSGGGRR
ncbi:MAG TPA: Bax inhibitor-1/YccA family protein [Acidimicrobiales bacterium]|nr:Bax inhibitor-1/YccA family protein [Acidimicrobiales bacterium]